MEQAAAAEEYERAARYRDLISTVEQLQERQRIAAAEGDDADVFGYHYENGMLAVNLFHMRGGRVVDRREFFWEDLPEFELPAGTENAQTEKEHAETGTEHVGTDAFARPAERSAPASPTTDAFNPGEFFSALLKQLYIGQPYVPRNLYVPVDFEDREDSGRLTLRPGRGREPAAPHEFISWSRSAATSARSSISPAPTPSNPTISVSACSSPMPKPSRKNCRMCSACLKFRSASNASTFPTFKARRRSLRWWSGKTAR